MTKQADDSPSGAEIEITPEMIEAGVQVLISLRNEGDELLVREILVAGLRLQRARAD